MVYVGALGEVMSKCVWVGLSVAALFVGAGSPAWAQDAAQTAGGDITADEATPLPPVVVQAPKERRKPARSPARPVAAPAAAAAAAAGDPSIEAVATGGVADEANAFAPGPSIGVFTLGQLDLIGGSTITNEAMWVYNKQSLDGAVNILPGVSSHSTGGARNERDIFVRGFDRLRVPLSVDGVRVYLPADNRLDFARFLTPDLAEVQVQKGYVSVLNGPGGMGGAINLVSRKPQKAFEFEARSGMVLDGDVSSIGQWNSYAYTGTRQRGWYGQVSGNIVDQDHFWMSRDFDPVRVANENGDERDHSQFKDWRINAKVGLTPNATDEYVINLTTQQGEKRAPLHVEGQRVQGPRFWDWPQWDHQSISWLSKTQLGSASYVKTNVYYNTFDSILASYDDANYNSQTTTGGQQGNIPFTFTSPYDDYAVGGFVEAGTTLIPMNTLKAAIHFRRDYHKEGDFIAMDGPDAFIEPKQHNEDETWSYALENTFHVTRNLDLIAGVSYNTNEVLRSEGLDEDDNLINNPLVEADAWDWQGGAVYRYAREGSVHATVSSRTRFPTTFDRYSTRFGTRDADPNLAPERATNYEIGWGETFQNSLKLSSAVFYSDIEDSIQNVFVNFSGNRSIVGINVPGETYGIEVSADWTITPSLRIGGNYTYMEREFDYAKAARDPFLDAPEAFAVARADAEGTPRHEAFIYLAWTPIAPLTVTPSLELASDRSSLITSCASTLVSGTPSNSNVPGCGSIPNAPRYPNYARIGSYALLNLQMEYRFDDNWTGAIGATNLLDQDYQLAQGFPEAGRQYFANMRAKF